jgi:hypothetical protein
MKISQAAFDLIVQEELMKLLKYEPDTGRFLWFSHPSSKCQVDVGQEAGCIEAKGYRIIKIHQKCYKAHRLAWLYMTGEWPKGMIDHIDRDPGNCKWRNLREATYSQNHANSVKALGRSGLRGASWSERAKKWKSSVRSGGKRIHLGYFDTAEDARSAYADAVAKFHGEWSPSC